MGEEEGSSSEESSTGPEQHTPPSTPGKAPGPKGQNTTKNSTTPLQNFDIKNNTDNIITLNVQHITVKEEIDDTTEEEMEVEAVPSPSNTENVDQHSLRDINNLGIDKKFIFSKLLYLKGEKP
jgi:hypothetical protein